MKWNGYEGTAGLLAQMQDSGASPEEMARVKAALSGNVSLGDFADLLMNQHATNMRLAAAIVAVASTESEKFTPALNTLLDGIDQQGNHMIDLLTRTLTNRPRGEGN